MAINNNPFTCSHVAFSLYYVFKENQVEYFDFMHTKNLQDLLGVFNQYYF